jgi:hypothetical protein
MQTRSTTLTLPERVKSLEWKPSKFQAARLPIASVAPIVSMLLDPTAAYATIWLETTSSPDYRSVAIGMIT